MKHVKSFNESKEDKTLQDSMEEFYRRKLSWCNKTTHKTLTKRWSFEKRQMESIITKK